MVKFTIDVNEILYDPEIYPREKYITSVINEYTDAMIAGAKFPAIAVEEGTGKLLDGVHRWKALLKWHELYKEDGSVVSEPPNEMVCEYHVVPEGIPVKLYALSLSSKHGLRLKNAEKEIVAQEAYKEKPGLPVKTIAQYIGVSEPTAKKYIESLIAEFEETKRSVIMRLNLLGWTQQEISDKLSELWPDAKGTAHDSVSRFIAENEKFIFATKTDLDKGHEPKTVAQRNALPEILAWAIKLQDRSDQEKMDELGIKIQPYDHWNFAGCGDLFGAEYPGRIPGELVAHTLYFFTEPGDMIIDSMAGSGTVPDVCLALGRKCYAYDLGNGLERPDFILHDMKTGWPERVSKANMIFWDPPYFEKRSEEYGEDSISSMDREGYLSFFALRLQEAKELVKKGTRLAFLMSDWDDNTNEREGIFIWDYADLIRNAGWRLVRHIQVPLSTQSVHADIVNKFRVTKRQARLERYLLIAEV